MKKCINCNCDISELYGNSKYCKICSVKVRADYKRRHAREYVRKYTTDPVVADKIKKYQKEYSQRPHVKEKRREHDREYSKRDYVKDRKNKYYLNQRWINKKTKEMLVIYNE
jgi:hypothetical protein